MMNLDPIRNRLRSQFNPFTLHLTDGRKIPVPHPDFIAVGRGIVVVVDGLHIVSVEDQVAPN